MRLERGPGQQGRVSWAPGAGVRVRAVGTREGCYLLQFFKLYNLEKFLQKHHFDGFPLPNVLPFLLNHSFLEEHLVGFTYNIHKWCVRHACTGNSDGVHRVPPRAGITGLEHECFKALCTFQVACTDIPSPIGHECVLLTPSTSTAGHQFYF